MLSDLVPQAVVEQLRQPPSQQPHRQLQHSTYPNQRDRTISGGSYDSVGDFNTPMRKVVPVPGRVPAPASIPGVVGGTPGLLRPLVGLKADEFDAARSRAEVIVCLCLRLWMCVLVNVNTEQDVSMVWRSG